MKGLKPLLVGNLLGKIIGVARELLLAALFGTGPTTAAYRIAQTATLTPVNFFTADALAAGFLPEHSRRLQRNELLAARYYWLIQRLLAAVSIALLLALVFLRDSWVLLLAPGLSDSTTRMAASMLAVMALGVPFYVSTATSSYLQMSHGSYGLASIRPAFQSIGLIAGTFLAFWFHNPIWLAIGFSAAYACLAIISFATIRNMGMASSKPNSQNLREDARIFWVRLRPMLLAPFFLQGSWAAERAAASLLGVTAVSAIDYSRMITDTIVVTVAGPMGLSLLVSLSTVAPEELQRRLRNAVSIFLTVFSPVAGILVLGAPTITYYVFQRGRFDSHSSHVVSQVLLGLGLGVAFQGLAALLLKALNARGRNAKAAMCIAVGSCVMVAFDFLMVGLLGPLAIGLGSTLGGMTQLALAAHALGVWRTLGRAFILNAPHLTIGIVLLIIAGPDPRLTNGRTLLCVIAGVSAMTIYVSLQPRLRSDVFLATRRVLKR